MRFTTTMCNAIVAASALACSGVPAVDDAEQSDSPVVALGDRGPEVVAAHAYFTRIGYFENAELRSEYPTWRPVAGRAPTDDSVFGEELHTAVSAFQARHGLAVTGAIDSATRRLVDTPRCGVPDSLDLEVEDKWAPWTARGWRSTFDLTYRVVGLPSSMGSFSNSTDILTYLQGAFDRWSDRTELTFRRVTGSTADITVTFANSNPWAATNTAGNITIDIGGGTTADPAIAWDKWPETTGIDFMSVAMHEIGHSLGFAHSSINATLVTERPLMWPFINTGETVDDFERDDHDAIATSPYTVWQGATGAANEANDIGASYTGNDAETVWMISTDAVSNGFAIFRWGGSSWVRINGGGTRIDVSGRVPWVTTSTGGVWSKAGVTQDSPNGNGWTDRGDIDAIDIGVNAGGVAWALGGTRHSDGDYDVYRHTGGTSWKKIDGDAFRIDVAPDGTPWLVTALGNIYRRTGVTSANPDGTGWARLGGVGQDIGVGRDGAVWLTGTDNRIYILNQQPGLDNNGDGDFNDSSDAPPRDLWEITDGRARSITVGIRSLPWVVGDDGSIWRRRGS